VIGMREAGGKIRVVDLCELHQLPVIDPEPEKDARKEFKHMPFCPVCLRQFMRFMGRGVR